MLSNKIPKVIHYIWLGNKRKSKLTEVCMNTWYRNLKDYKIIEWNESNLDIDKLCKHNAFLKKCVELKLWAFVSDYLRLYILFNEGGIYFDTDIEVLKSLDPLLDRDMFIGYEEKEQICTAVIGATKENPKIKKILQFYDQDIWNVDEYINTIIFKNIIKKNPEIFSKLEVLDKDVFSPYRLFGDNNGLIEKVQSYTIHWYSKNWGMSRKGYVFLNTKHIKSPVKGAFAKLRKNIGYFRRLYSE